MQSLSLVMSECFVSGRGHGHVSNFYIVDLENFATEVVGIQVIYTTRRHRFVYDTLPPTIPPTSYHRFGQDLWYKYFLHCCVVIGKITTDKTHRAVTRR